MMLKLRVESQLSPYPFVGKPIEIDIYLTDEQDHLKSGEDVKLAVIVTTEDGVELNQSKVLEIVENTGIQKNGPARIVVKFLDVSASYEKKRFVLNFKPIQTNLKIPIAQSTPMYCVRYKLHVEEENKSPFIWYKDEGGKDKCIEYKVSLRDANGRTFKDRKVPLKVNLNYVNGTPVSQQNILVLSPDSRLVIDDHGDAILKLRINEVSNRHRGQLFQVEILSDVMSSASSADVAPILCMPVDVKSKRNKGPSVKNPRDDVSSAPSSQLEHNKKAKTSHGASMFGVPYATSSAAFSQPSIGSKRNSEQFSFGMNEEDSNRQLFQSTGANVGDAVNSLVNWAGTIMKGIEAIQWREIGYEQNPDGTPNLLRPLFNIPNPNAILNEIVEQYSTQVISSLQLLQQVANTERQSKMYSRRVDIQSTIENGGNTPIDSDEEDEPSGNQSQSLPTKPKLDSRNNSAIASRNDFLPIAALERGLSNFSNVDELFNTVLNRERSSLDIPEIKRNNSLFLDADRQFNDNGQGIIPVPALMSSFSSSWAIGNVFDLNGDNGAESQVQYIIAEIFKTSGGVSGLPAFNLSKSLIGLYREVQGQSTSVKFVPVTSLIPPIKPSEFAQLKDKLEKFVSSKEPSPRLFTLPKNGKIEVLREDALIYTFQNDK